MSIINEKFGSPNLQLDAQGLASSATRIFNILAESDEATVIADFAAFLIPSFLGLPLQGSGIVPNEGSFDTWIGTAEYSSDGQSDESAQLNSGEEVSNFQIGTQSLKRLASLETTTTYPLGQPAGTPDPLYHQLINVNNDGTVQGVDFLVPNIIETITKQFPKTFLTAAKRKDIADIMATTNIAIFKDWDISEVLLIGFGTTDAGAGNVNITYTFSIQRIKTITVQLLPLPAAKTNIVAGGHKFIWYRYKEIENNAGATPKKVIVKVPVNAYTERLYDVSDFTKLGLA